MGDWTASIATSMRLAEHESEGDNEELITDIVVDVQPRQSSRLRALVGDRTTQAA